MNSKANTAIKKHNSHQMKPSTSVIRSALLSVLRQEGHPNWSIPESCAEQRNLLGDVLISSSTQWKRPTLELLDKVWTAELPKQYTTLQDLTSHVSANVEDTQIIVWEGDITKLSAVDAIVNAANDQGLGCFIPHHKCIDNCIHRAAGPRLRLACEQAMRERKYLLTAGSPAMVTSAYFLPTRYVVHVTGPQIKVGDAVTADDCAKLSKAYENCLDAALQHGIKSIAFPCISTGLFGFPSDQAAQIAVSTVKTWLQKHPGRMETIVLDVFSGRDLELYKKQVHEQLGTAVTMSTDPRTESIALAKEWIQEADAVLICAGAGMSVKEGEMVYTNREDFAKHYPWFLKWGYSTSYEVMGLGHDPSVPMNAKWALHAKHMDNMRWRFTPNQGYEWLKELVGAKDYFVLTSNVDGCFERAGFDPSRIYTPQGEWTFLQCMQPCRPDSVFPARPYLDKLLANISADGFIPVDLIPKCPRCGSDMFGNVRGGSWFLHHEKYEKQNQALQDWMADLLLKNTTQKVVVLEVGAGFNTPTVTRFPVESWTRALGPHRAGLIRINPTDVEVPGDLKAIALSEGWQALEDIKDSPVASVRGKNDLEARVQKENIGSGLVVPLYRQRQMEKYIGHFDWRIFLKQLRDQRHH